jgi:thioredoxin reductase (NADPH)
MKKVYDMLIVGGGPGGYSAALYAARAGLSAAVLERMSIGGQMALTHQIDNYPGFAEGVDGYNLGDQMRRGAERFGAQTILTDVQKLELQGERKLVHTSEGVLEGRTVVLATGAGPRPLGLERESEFIGSGLSYCAHCDGMFFRNKTVAVVGGGNSAVGDALILSRICKEVILIHRRDQLRATRLYHKQLEEAGNIRILWNSVPTALLGDARLEGLEVQNVQSGEKQTLSLDGLFVSIGRIPATELVKGQLALDENGYILAGESTATGIPGVFAVGDVRTKALRQIITAAADGAVAAHHAEEFLNTR